MSRNEVYILVLVSVLVLLAFMMFSGANKSPHVSEIGVKVSKMIGGGWNFEHCTPTNKNCGRLE